MSALERVCLIGFGEVGQILGAELPRAGVPAVTAWDTAFPDPASVPARALAKAEVTAGADAEEAAAGATLIISAVTAAETLAAARSVCGALAPGAWLLDLNSAAPGTKTTAARAVAAAGGRYVEAAVMSPVPPKRLATPMLLGGPHAAAFLPVAEALGFSGLRVFSADYGKASAAKMCRSAIVKGIEALLTESLVAARHHGVEADVVESLSDLFPGPDWRDLSHYMISRSLEHGTRRSEEMREVAHTVLEAGLEPLMSLACAERQAWAASHRALAAQPELTALLDALLTAIAGETGAEAADEAPLAEAR